ncbi:MAG: hypothetical protein ACK56I_30375, partial [bacterium]
TLQSVGTEPISCGQQLKLVYEIAASAMWALFLYFNAYTVTQQELVLGTKVYLTTGDVCLKAWAGSAGPTSKLLFRERNLPGAVTDEFHKLPEFRTNAILSALPAAIFGGDWRQ